MKLSIILNFSELQMAARHPAEVQQPVASQQKGKHQTQIKTSHKICIMAPGMMDTVSGLGSQLLAQSFKHLWNFQSDLCLCYAKWWTLDASGWGLVSKQASLVIRGLEFWTSPSSREGHRRLSSIPGPMI